MKTKHGQERTDECWIGRSEHDAGGEGEGHGGCDYCEEEAYIDAVAFAVVGGWGAVDDVNRWFVVVHGCFVCVLFFEDRGSGQCDFSGPPSVEASYEKRLAL